MTKDVIRKYLKPYRKVIVIDRLGREREGVFLQLKDDYIYIEHKNGTKIYDVHGEHDFKPL